MNLTVLLSWGHSAWLPCGPDSKLTTRSDQYLTERQKNLELQTGWNVQPLSYGRLVVSEGHTNWSYVPQDLHRAGTSQFVRPRSSNARDFHSTVAERSTRCLKSDGFDSR